MTDQFDSYTKDEISSAAYRYVDKKLPNYLFNSKRCLEKIPSFREEVDKLESKLFKKEVFGWIDHIENRAKEELARDKKWDRASEILKAVK